MSPLILWIFLSNAISFALFGADKKRAVRHAWRIPEAVLLLSAASFGGAGAILGSFIFRHKTRKMKFLVLLPICAVIQAILSSWIVL